MINRGTMAMSLPTLPIMNSGGRLPCCTLSRNTDVNRLKKQIIYTMISTIGIKDRIPRNIFPFFDISKPLQQGKKKNHKITYLQHQNLKYASRFTSSFLVGDCT